MGIGYRASPPYGRQKQRITTDTRVTLIQFRFASEPDRMTLSLNRGAQIPCVDNARPGAGRCGV